MRAYSLMVNNIVRSKYIFVENVTTVTNFCFDRCNYSGELIFLFFLGSHLKLFREINDLKHVTKLARKRMSSGSFNKVIFQAAFTNELAHQ